MKYIWVYTQVCSYKYSKIYKYLKYSKGFSIILAKQGGYQNLTQIVTFIDTYRDESHHCINILSNIDGNYQVITLFSPW